MPSKNGLLKTGIAWVLPPAAAVLISVFAGIAGIDRLDPVSTAFWVCKAAWLETADNQQDALAALDRLTLSRWIRSPTVVSWKSELHREYGIELFLHGRFSDAASHFEQVHTERGPDYFALIYLGICSQKTGFPDTAVLNFDRAIEQYPKRQDAYLVKGHYYMISGDIASAEHQYELAIENAPNLGFIRVEIGDAYRYAQNLEQAEKYYRQAFETDGGDIFAKLRIAEMQCYYHSNREYAVSLVQEIMVSAPGWHQMYELKSRMKDFVPGDPVEFVSLRTYQLKHDFKTGHFPERFFYECMRPEWRGDE